MGGPRRRLPDHHKPGVGIARRERTGFGDITGVLAAGAGTNLILKERKGQRLPLLTYAFRQWRNRP
jgi:hypothetical protein